MSKKKSLEELTEGYIEGLPFTLDFKRMFQKTLDSRYVDKSGTKELIELSKLALENADSKVRVSNGRKKLTVEFDGEGVSSEDDLINLIFSLYKRDSSEEGQSGQNMKRLGGSLLAALAQNPKGVLVETHSGDKSINMEIDTELKPRIYPPTRPNLTNRITVYRNPVFEFKNPFKQIKKLVKRTRPQDKLLAQISDFAKFTDLDFRYNGKKIGRGMHIDDALFEAEYSVRNSKILFGIPKSSIDRDKSKTYLKNGIKLEQHMLSYADSDWTKFQEYSLSFNDKYRNHISIPEIIVENPKLSENISGDLVNDKAYKAVNDDIDAATKLFTADLLQGKFDNPNWSKYSPENKELEKIVQAVLLRKMDEGEVSFGGIRTYVEDKENYLANLDSDAAKELENFFSLKLFKDVLGHDYTIPELYAAIQEHPNRQCFTAATKPNVSHPVVKKHLSEDYLILHFPTRMERKVFNSIFNKKISKKERVQSKYDFYGSQYYVYNNTDLWGNSIKNSIFNPSSIDDMIMSHNRDLELSRKKLRQKIGKGAKTTGIVSGITAAAGGIGVGGYLLLPYIVANGTVIGAVVGGIAAAAGIGYGGYKAAPYVGRGIKSAAQATKRGVSKVAKGIRRQGNKFISSVQERKQSLDHKMNEIRTNMGSRYAEEGFMGRVLDFLDKYFPTKEEARERKYRKKLEREDKKRKAEKEKLEHIVELNKVKNLNLMRDSFGRMGDKYGLGLDPNVEIFLDRLNAELFTQDRTIYNAFSNFSGMELAKQRTGNAFSLKTDSNKCRKLVIAPRTLEFEKLAEEYVKTEGRSVYASLSRIADDANGFVFGQDSKIAMSKFDRSVIDTLFSVESQICDDLYAKQDEEFKGLFDAMPEESQIDFLAGILDNSEKSNEAENNLDSWLIENYEPLLDAASEKIVTRGSDIDPLIKKYNTASAKKQSEMLNNAFINHYPDMVHKHANFFKMAYKNDPVSVLRSKFANTCLNDAQRMVRVYSGDPERVTKDLSDYLHHMNVAELNAVENYFAVFAPDDNKTFDKIQSYKTKRYGRGNEASIRVDASSNLDLSVFEESRVQYDPQKQKSFRDRQIAASILLRWKLDGFDSASSDKTKIFYQNLPELLEGNEYKESILNILKETKGRGYD